MLTTTAVARVQTRTAATPWFTTPAICLLCYQVTSPSVDFTAYCARAHDTHVTRAVSACPAWHTHCCWCCPTCSTSPMKACHTPGLMRPASCCGTAAALCLRLMMRLAPESGCVQAPNAQTHHVNCLCSSKQPAVTSYALLVFRHPTGRRSSICTAGPQSTVDGPGCHPQLLLGQLR